MSAHVTMLTPMTDEECLIAAIVANGFIKHNLICSVEPVELRGWKKGRTANIVLRKEYTGDHYNDIGFRSSATGFIAIISDDNATYGSRWLRSVNESYLSLWTSKQERLIAEERQRLEDERQRLVEAQRQTVHERAKKMGYQVKESREGDSIRMVLVKRTY